jgi:hypothetical protein
MDFELTDMGVAFHRELTQLPAGSVVFTDNGAWTGEVGIGHDWVVIRKAKRSVRNPSNFWIDQPPQIFPRERVLRIEVAPHA